MLLNATGEVLVISITICDVQRSTTIIAIVIVFIIVFKSNSNHVTNIRIY